MKTLIVPKEIIKQIKYITENKIVEYGGWLEYSGDIYKKIKKFKGDTTSVYVPTANYELHYHTHPASLIVSNDENFNKSTGPFQPPSIQDIGHTSYKYFSSEFARGNVLRQIVFTKEAIYIQEPIPSILNNFFKNKSFSISNERHKKFWINNWFIPFEKESSPIRKKLTGYSVDIGGYKDKDTGETVYYPPEVTEGFYEECIKLEKKYFLIAKKYGVNIIKIPNWNKALKNGLSIKIQ